MSLRVHDAEMQLHAIESCKESIDHGLSIKRYDNHPLQWITKKLAVLRLSRTVRLSHLSFWSSKRKTDKGLLSKVSSFQKLLTITKYVLFCSATDEVLLKFRFKENEFQRTIRHQPFTVVEFIAQFGGLLGLFVGASFLSVVEIFYFFSFRLVVNILRSFRFKKGSAIRSA